MLFVVVCCSLMASLLLVGFCLFADRVCFWLFVDGCVWLCIDCYLVMSLFVFGCLLFPYVLMASLLLLVGCSLLIVCWRCIVVVVVYVALVCVVCCFGVVALCWRY